MKRRLHAVASLSVVGAILFSGYTLSPFGAAADDGPRITVPDNFRTEYEFLGAWAVAGDADTGSEIGQHIVYASPGTVEAFRKTGRFPDGAVLVKELFSGKTEALTTGNATSAAEVAGYFVMVKDAENTLSGPLWGDGWGWAFFEPGNTKKTISTDYRADCLSCHEPVRESDLVYSYAYPVLKR